MASTGTPPSPSLKRWPEEILDETGRACPRFGKERAFLPSIAVTVQPENPMLTAEVTATEPADSSPMIRCTSNAERNSEGPLVCGPAGQRPSRGGAWEWVRKRTQRPPSTSGIGL